jgi:hypothetical protein
VIRVENVEERSAGPVGETTGRKRVAVRNRRGRGRRRRNIIGAGNGGLEDSEPRTSNFANLDRSLPYKFHKFHRTFDAKCNVFHVTRPVRRVNDPKLRLALQHTNPTFPPPTQQFNNVTSGDVLFLAHSPH